MSMWISRDKKNVERVMNSSYLSNSVLFECISLMLDLLDEPGCLFSHLPEVTPPDDTNFGSPTILEVDVTEDNRI